MMHKPAQIIVIPQNMLSQQSINILKQRQVLPNNGKITLPTLKQKPVATVAGNQRQFVAVQPQMVMPSPPASPPLKMKRSLSPDIDIKEEEDENYQPARKRTNLDHMSSDEKLQRRKLKNRVAAQNARDKKKAYIDELEIHLNDIREQKKLVELERNKLKADNERLSLQNSRLSLENSTLSERNLALEKRLGLDTTENYILPLSPESIPRTPSPTGSLASCTDQLKGGQSIFMEDSEPEPAAGNQSPFYKAGGTSADDLLLSSPDTAVGVHSVVVPRLDDLVAELCREESGEVINNVGVMATASVDLGNQLDAAPHNQHHLTLEIPLNQEDQPEFQFLQDIDVFGDDAAATIDDSDATWETATVNEGSINPNRFSSAAKEETFEISFASPVSNGSGVNDKLVMTQQQLPVTANSNSTQDIHNSLDEDLLMTPTAEKLLEEIWFENMNQEAEECIEHIYPDLD